MDGRRGPGGRPCGRTRSFARLDVAVGDRGGEAGHRLGGVDRVEDQALAAAGVVDRARGPRRSAARSPGRPGRAASAGRRRSRPARVTKPATRSTGSGTAPVSTPSTRSAPSPATSPAIVAAGADADDDVAHVGRLLEQLLARRRRSRGADRARAAVGQDDGARDARPRSPRGRRPRRSRRRRSRRASGCPCPRRACRHEHDVQPEPARRGRGQPRVVALRGAARDQRRRARRDRLAAQVLELAQLVAAAAVAEPVVALDPQVARRRGRAAPRAAARAPVGSSRRRGQRPSARAAAG